MSRAMSLEIEAGDDRTLITIAGVIDEHAVLDPITSIESRTRLDLSGIRRFNSVGIRLFVDAIRGLVDSAGYVEVVRCSPAVVDQLNMISGFLAHAPVRSFQAPMICPACEAESVELFDAGQVRDLDRLPPTQCPECSRPMDLDDNEDTYLLFLREPTRVGSH